MTKDEIVANELEESGLGDMRSLLSLGEFMSLLQQAIEQSEQTLGHVVDDVIAAAGAEVQALASGDPDLSKFVHKTRVSVVALAIRRALDAEEALDPWTDKPPPPTPGTPEASA